MLPFPILRCTWISFECIFLFLFFLFVSLWSLFHSVLSVSCLGLSAWYWTLHKEAVRYTGRLYHHGGDPVGTPFPYSAMACACASLPDYWLVLAPCLIRVSPLRFYVSHLSWFLFLWLWTSSSRSIATCFLVLHLHATDDPIM